MDDETLVTTRRALHALAEQAISPLRVQATGHEIALAPRPGGFGTPDLPGGGWVGVVGTDVVRVDAGGEERREVITSVRAAARFVGLEGAGALSDAPLELHSGATIVIADAFALANDALRALVDGAPPADDASAIALWPEHFDLAIELGPDGARGTYGVSPGDDDHEQPYAYVSLWQGPPAPADRFWNASGFTGAERHVDDAEELTTFWRAVRARLTA